jgi:hypothetical protein
MLISVEETKKDLESDILDTWVQANGSNTPPEAIRRCKSYKKALHDLHIDPTLLVTWLMLPDPGPRNWDQWQKAPVGKPHKWAEHQAAKDFAEGMNEEDSAAAVPVQGKNVLDDLPPFTILGAGS